MLILGTNRRPTRYSGKIISFEGIDGSGKTTALEKCYERAQAAGYDVVWTEWGDSKLAGKALKKGKKKHRMTPITFTLLQACSIADRLETDLLPFLRKGGIVFADRWIYTCLARDVVRGVDRKYVREVLSFAPEADVAVYFKLPPKVALERKLSFDDEGIQFYEAGQDLYPDLSREDGFLKFQGEVGREYDRIAKEYDMCVLDADQDMDAVERDAWAFVSAGLATARKAA